MVSIDTKVLMNDQSVTIELQVCERPGHSPRVFLVIRYEGEHVYTHEFTSPEECKSWSAKCHDALESHDIIT